MASLATTNGAQNRRWASTINKHFTETHNLKILILVKCSSLCCAKWFFTQHSHMPSPALKQRVHRDDTASEGTTRTNALLVLNKKIRGSRPHHSLHESQTHPDANHQPACFAVHTKRTVIETNSLAARGQQGRTPDETKTIHKHCGHPQCLKKEPPRAKEKTNCAQIISAHEETFRTWITKEIPRTEK